jgi:Pentapeptide repeats (8 copies)
LLQGLGGAFFFVTAYIALENLKVAEENRETAKKTLQMTEDKQVTERFVKAVEMLAHQEPDIRLGGIYSLERIAKDSEEDRWTIQELLSSYIRRKSPWNSSAIDGEYTDITEDIQAALTVIGLWQACEGKKINLTGSNLQGASLVRANLAEAVLESVNLKRANLHLAVLIKAEISGDISGAKFSEAKLQGAQLSSAKLKNAFFGGANLEKAWVGFADLRGANFSNAELSDVTFLGSNIDGADFRRAKNLMSEQFVQTDNRETALYDLDRADHFGLSRDEQVEIAKEKHRELVQSIDPHGLIRDRLKLSDEVQKQETTPEEDNQEETESS